MIETGNAKVINNCKIKCNTNFLNPNSLNEL